jgi:hypothetical protein
MRRADSPTPSCVCVGRCRQRDSKHESLGEAGGGECYHSASTAALAWWAAIFDSDVESIKHDTAPASAGGKAVIVSVVSVSQDNTGREAQVLDYLSAIEIVAALV